MPRIVRRLALVTVGGLVVALLGWIGWLWYESRLPETYSVMDYGLVDYGGGTELTGSHHDLPGAVSVVRLTGPAGVPDKRFALTARQARVRLASGREIDALTFGGRVPGPELRVRQGDLVEVTLRNEDIEDGVTIHWHGVDVPNAEDGVASVTQNAVLPGARHTYRFRADQVGTFWYHTHQVSSKQVRRGLYGALVIEPAERAPGRRLDLALVAHTLDGYPTLNAHDGVDRRAAAPGTNVRLRLVNSDSSGHRFTLAGTPFRVLALDGTDLNGPTTLENLSLEVPAGGRTDVGFTMPPRAVRLSLQGTSVGLALSRDGRALPPPGPLGPTFDPLSYGRPAATPFPASSPFDRTYDLTIGRRPGFLDGKPGLQWTLDGKIYPDVPVFLVRRGDLAKVTIANNTGSSHPMHLHGHHVLVLSRNGVPSSGGPWWADTLEVKEDETYVIAFRADNPGIWMDHCHNLSHAAAGLTMHLAYAGTSTPFNVGDATGNQPE
jgi:FtsP/CotA-like multicopper oxidase with cupredoxin domain